MLQKETSPKSSKWSLQSRLGALLPLGCAIHCAVSPLLALLSIGNGIHSSGFSLTDLLFLAFGLGIGLVVLVRSFRQHQQKSPLIWFSIGTIFLVIAQYFHLHLVALVAALFCAYALWNNHKVSQKTCSCPLPS
ncbi:MAG: MerC domain-containing protein [Chitinophagales bacterium]|nr:MerC domain-containing protein [Bacteroidota bacterium]MCB9043964.1 MerC domain-containing protein [Chitinophagales bacterium]